jgi:heterodisulfide reductase subunit B
MIDKNKYPENWDEISARIRFERAANRCENCGVENYAINPKTGKKVILTVAHINHDTTDNREENLKALCQYCHLNLDRRNNQYRRKYGKDFTNQLTINFDQK